MIYDPLFSLNEIFVFHAFVNASRFIYIVLVYIHMNYEPLVLLICMKNELFYFMHSSWKPHIDVNGAYHHIVFYHANMWPNIIHRPLEYWLWNFSQLTQRSHFQYHLVMLWRIFFSIWRVIVVFSKGCWSKRLIQIHGFIFFFDVA